MIICFQVLLSISNCAATPWLNDRFENLRYVITDRVVNGAPVWAAEGGDVFMYRGKDSLTWWVGVEENCAGGNECGFIHHYTPSEAQRDYHLAPSTLPLDKWMSNSFATLEPQYIAAGGNDEADDLLKSWVRIPDVYTNVEHGLDDDEPAIVAAFAALRQLR